ncbi:MAG: hypothetical protein LBU32_25505 [Clostridiales bacterium]|jgi:hypothetical protein|nr:hypothetical protein [Clostridiales bacterium]
MSEHIVHTGILEDSFAIAPNLTQIPADFREVMKKHLGFARLGCVTVAGDQFSFRLLEEFRPLWPRRDDILDAKLAFVLGWVSHRACDRVMKPIWNITEIFGRGSDADPSLSPTECSVYHEGALYNLYYKDDPTFRLAIFPDQLAALPGAELFDLKLAGAYVQSAFGMNMLNIQTFPVSNGGQALIENVCVQSQKFYVDVTRYAKACGSPEAEKLRNFVTDINWYDADDPLLRLANKLRLGGSSSTAECESALAKPASGYYAQALRLSISYIISAADYVKDPGMTLNTLKERLDIGKKGPNGLSV